MTDDLETPPSDFLKGYNQGYLMAEYFPDLAKEIAEALPDTTLGNAFKKGREQHLSEKDKGKTIDRPGADAPLLPTYLRKDWRSFEGPDMEQEKDEIDRD